MGALNGHIFFAAEVEPALSAAANEAQRLYFETLEYEFPVEERKRRAKNFADVVSAKTKVNQAIRKDEFAASPHLYAFPEELWTQTDAALSPFASMPGVGEVIGRLSLDTKRAQGASLVGPLAFAGVAGALAYLSYRLWRGR